MWLFVNIKKKKSREWERGCLLFVVGLRWFSILNFKNCFDFKIVVYLPSFYRLLHTLTFLPKRVIKIFESLMQRDLK